MKYVHNAIQKRIIAVLKVSLCIYRVFGFFSVLFGFSKGWSGLFAYDYLATLAVSQCQWALSSWEIGDGMWDWWLDEHRGGSRVRRSPLLKPTQVTLFTMILYNLENSNRDIESFCRPLFCYISILHLSYSSESIMRL